MNKLALWLSRWLETQQAIIAAVTTRVAPYYWQGIRRFNALPRKAKIGVSAGISIALHLLLLFFLLYAKQSGLASRGTTGEGFVNGAGFVVDVAVIDALRNPTPNQLATQQVEALALEAEKMPKERKVEKINDKAEALKVTFDKPDEETAKTADDAESEKSLEAAKSGGGATGQSGQADADLWGAIAPCWNRNTGGKPFNATLVISFAEDGTLSVPPIIQREYGVVVTDQMLHSEALALQSLAECGPYPMAAGQQNITVIFPPPVPEP